MNGGGALPCCWVVVGANFSTCRLSDLSICWEVGKLESWRGGPEEAREVRVGG